MPNPATPHTVFVSHAHADNALADRYVEALRKRGLNVWYDRTNLQLGDSLSETIEKQLRQRTALVVLYTSTSVKSKWVRREVAAFQRLADQDPSRVLIAVKAAECDVPLLMTDSLWADAVALGFDAAVEAMAAALGATPATPQPDEEESEELADEESEEQLAKIKALRDAIREMPPDAFKFNTPDARGRNIFRIFEDTPADLPKHRLGLGRGLDALLPDLPKQPDAVINVEDWPDLLAEEEEDGADALDADLVEPDPVSPADTPVAHGRDIFRIFEKPPTTTQPAHTVHRPTLQELEASANDLLARADRHYQQGHYQLAADDYLAVMRLCSRIRATYPSSTVVDQMSGQAAQGRGLAYERMGKLP